MILKNKEGKKTKCTSDCIEIKGNDGNSARCNAILLFSLTLIFI